jgi:hypothetical protein
MDQAGSVEEAANITRLGAPLCTLVSKQGETAAPNWTASKKLV